MFYFYNFYNMNSTNKITFKESIDSNFRVPSWDLSNINFSQEEIEKAISVDISKYFNNNILDIFKMQRIKSYYQMLLNDLYYNDKLFKYRMEVNKIFYDENKFFNKIENLIFFLEYRYQKFFEEEFYLSYENEIKKSNKNYNNIIEPKIIFIFNKNNINTILNEIKVSSNLNAIIKKELLWFWIAYNEDDVKKYSVNYHLNFKNTNFKKEFEWEIIKLDKKVDILYSENGWKNKWEIKKVNKTSIIWKMIEKGFNINLEYKLTWYLYFWENEKKLFSSKYILWEYYNDSIFEDKNIPFSIIQNIFFEEIENNKSEMKKYIIKNELSKWKLNNIYDIEDIIFEKSKLVKNVEIKNIKKLLTTFRIFDNKLWFLLYWKDPEKWLHNTAWNVYPILTRLLHQIDETISWYSEFFKEQVCFSIDEKNLNIKDFEDYIKSKFNLLHTDRVKKISEDIIKVTKLIFDIELINDNKDENNKYKEEDKDISNALSKLHQKD